MPNTTPAQAKAAVVGAQASAAQVISQGEPQEHEAYDLIVACRSDGCITLPLRGVPITDRTGLPTGQFLTQSASFLDGQRVSSEDVHPAFLALFEGGDKGVTSTVYRDGEERPDVYDGPNVDDDNTRNPQVDQAERARVAKQQAAGAR